MIGHELLGTGPLPVVILNDWMADTSTWDGARASFDLAPFTWAFVDVRGYGRSRAMPGAYVAEEIAGDVLGLANAKGWARFAVVGHSMSTIPALHLAQHEPERIAGAALITPPPPRGFGVDAATLEALRAVGRGDDEHRRRALEQRLAVGLSPGWVRFKLERWRACADPEAVAGYVEMYATRGLPDPTRRASCPVLAITGERDVEPMREAAVREHLARICERLTVTALRDSGHYPMQEAPPRTVALLEDYLRTL